MANTRLFLTVVVIKPPEMKALSMADLDCRRTHMASLREAERQFMQTQISKESPN